MPIHISTAPTNEPPVLSDLQISVIGETTTARVTELWVSLKGSTTADKYYQFGLHLAVLSRGTVYVLTANGSIDHQFTVDANAICITKSYRDNHFYILSSGSDVIKAYTTSGLRTPSKDITAPTNSRFSLLRWHPSNSFYGFRSTRYNSKLTRIRSNSSVIDSSTIRGFTPLRDVAIDDVSMWYIFPNSTRAFLRRSAGPPYSYVYAQLLGISTSNIRIALHNRDLLYTRPKLGGGFSLYRFGVPAEKLYDLPSTITSTQSVTVYY